MVQEGLNPGIHCTIYRQVNRLASMSLRDLGGSKPIPESLAVWEPILGSSTYVSQEVLNLIYGRREMLNEYGQFQELLEACELLIF